MAVAQAQHAVRDLANLLEDKGIEVEYAIHPVAGRMPGHMNVLLAEADVPYDKLKEMDEINPTMEQVDVGIVVGANDVVNPVARTDPSSPIAGMPIIDVDKARTVVVIKRSLSPGLRRHPEPAVRRRQHADVLRRRQEGDARPAGSAQGILAQTSNRLAIPPTQRWAVLLCPGAGLRMTLASYSTAIAAFLSYPSPFPYPFPTNSRSDVPGPKFPEFGDEYRIAGLETSGTGTRTGQARVRGERLSELESI